MFTPEQKDAFLAHPMDALVVNAAGGSLDPRSVSLVAANDRVRVVCGSENLVMPDERAGAEVLRAAKKAYAPTELGGMMGYLTAVEEYLARVEGVPFDVHTLYDAAATLAPASERAVRRARETGFAESFSAASSPHFRAFSTGRHSSRYS